MTAPAILAPSRSPAARVAEVVVRVDGLTKRFPVRRSIASTVRHPFAREFTTSVQDVSCEIRAGEFFGLLGPNGAGKTTLLKILATLILPDEGTATVGGHDVVRDAAAVRRLLTPVIANERSLYWRLSARENLLLFAALLDVPRDETEARVDEMLKVVELGDTGSKMVAQFSSGMMQRLLIARALLPSPRVLLLDEPTRSLDPISARGFRRFLREELAERRGCAVLLATHSADEAFELCDRVAVLHRGKLLATGTTDELSRQFTGDRYRVWTTAPDHPAFAAAVSRGGVRRLGAADVATDAWTRVDFEIDGGLDGSARFLDVLATSGVPVARFESTPVSLAELIERVVERQGAR